ncbi:hypothetical protein PybrP1_001721 [[Pythium] brassicae (nom. inval.)]|nr:hypothetical protein PybrP1_001721 [[Pythium] brassicae (nom. inval.)]
MLLRTTEVEPTTTSASLSAVAATISRHALLVWLVYASVALLLLALSVWVVLYFQPRRAPTASLPALAATSTLSAAPLQVSSRFVSAICASALYLSLICLFTPPVDVYVLENALPAVPASAQAALHVLYQVYFAALASYSFLGAPLVYNYAKQTEIAHLTMRFAAKQRFLAALKRTACFFLGFSLVLVMAMVILLCGKPVSSDVEWLKPLLKISSDLEMLLRLLIGILVLFGLYLWVAVASRGLASVPVVGLLIEDHGNDENRTTFQDLLHENAMETQATAQTKDTILRRYATAQALSVADQDRLQQLKLREQILADRRGVLDANLQQFTLGTRLACWKRPIGAALLLLSLLSVASLLLTSVDKLLHSSFARGFLLNQPVLPNPVDALLVLASRVFPLDYVLFGVLFLYVFLVAFVVLTRHGARFLCFRMDRLQPRLTSSSTMVVVSLVMIYLAIVGLFSTLTLAPQYATFGHQAFVDTATGRVVPCTLAEAAAAATTQSPHCRMTQLAHFYNTLAANVPLFGAAFFVGQLLFVLAFVPWLAHAVAMARALPDPDPKRERLLSNY